MSSPSGADRPADWLHGLTPIVLARVRRLVNPLHTPATLTFDPQLEIYRRLYAATPAKWGDVLGRYRIFQDLRKREDETEADHRTRQARWLCGRRRWERQWTQQSPYPADFSTAREPEPGEFFGLGTWFAEAEHIADSELEFFVSEYPTGRVLVLDIAADKARLMARISELIDRERQASGIMPATRRGPAARADRKLAAAQRCWPHLIDSARREAGLQPGPPYPDLDWRPAPPQQRISRVPEKRSGSPHCPLVGSAARRPRDRQAGDRAGAVSQADRSSAQRLAAKHPARVATKD